MPSADEAPLPANRIRRCRAIRLGAVRIVRRRRRIDTIDTRHHAVRRRDLVRPVAGAEVAEIGRDIELDDTSPVGAMLGIEGGDTGRVTEHEQVVGRVRVRIVAGGRTERHRNMRRMQFSDLRFGALLSGAVLLAAPRIAALALALFLALFLVLTLTLTLALFLVLTLALALSLAFRLIAAALTLAFFGLAVGCRRLRRCRCLWRRRGRAFLGWRSRRRRLRRWRRRRLWGSRRRRFRCARRRRLRSTLGVALSCS